MVNIKKLEEELEETRKIFARKEAIRKTKLDISDRAKEIKLEIQKLKGDKIKAIKIKGGKIARRTGRGFKILVKKATPIVKKQFKLIAEQQRREAAVERKRTKKIKKSSTKTFAPKNIFDLDF